MYSIIEEKIDRVGSESKILSVTESWMSGVVSSKMRKTRNRVKFVAFLLKIGNNQFQNGNILIEFQNDYFQFKIDNSHFEIDYFQFEFD